ncbi:MAG: hypothetical protein H7843_03550 [Nitrospirota bacterium]
MSLLQLDDEKGFPSPVYLLNYKDYFYQVESLRMLRSSVRDITFNFDVYDLEPGDEHATMAEITDTLMMASLFAARRFICVKNFQKALKGDITRLTRYVENPSPTSVLFLFNQLPDKSNKPKGDKPPLPFAVKTITLDFNERELLDWGQKKVQSYGCTITREALRFLKEICGDSASKFSNELDKLPLLGKKKIDETDAAEAVFGTKTYTIFNVTDAIVKGNRSKAVAMYAEIRDGLDELMTLGALNWKLEKEIHADTPAFMKCCEQLNDVNKRLRGANQRYPLELLIYNLSSPPAN